MAGARPDPQCTARGEHGAVRVTWLPKAVGKWHSLFLESDSTPWDDDLACARAAHAALGVEICCAGRLGGKPGRRGRRPLAGSTPVASRKLPGAPPERRKPRAARGHPTGPGGVDALDDKAVSRRAFACGNQTLRRLPLAGLSGPGSPRIPLSGPPPGAVTLAADGAVVNEHVRTAIALNESITFGVIEPLDGSDLTISHYHTLQLAIFISGLPNPGRLRRFGCATLFLLSDPGKMPLERAFRMAFH